MCLSRLIARKFDFEIEKLCVCKLSCCELLSTHIKADDWKQAILKALKYY